MKPRTSELCLNGLAKSTLVSSQARETFDSGNPRFVEVKGEAEYSITRVRTVSKYLVPSLYLGQISYIRFGYVKREWIRVWAKLFVFGRSLPTVRVPGVRAGLQLPSSAPTFQTRVLNFTPEYVPNLRARTTFLRNDKYPDLQPPIQFPHQRRSPA